MRKQGIVVCALLMAIACAANGALVSFDLTIEYSGATPPDGAAPWLNATFDDEGSAGSVILTLTTTNLTDDEFVSYWMFNLDTALDPTALDFTLLSETGSFTAPDDEAPDKDPNIRFKAHDVKDNDFKASGDGYFDIRIKFAIGGGAVKRFGVGETVEYTITTDEVGVSLTADSFDFLSEPDGGHGPYPTVAHVQGIGEDSGWVTTPEPASASLLVLGGLALLKRKRKS